MVRSPRRVVLARILVWLTAAAIACAGGGHARRPPPVPPGAAPRVADPAPEPAWRDYVPARCRDQEGNATPSCRARRIVTTSTSIELLDAVAFTGDTAELAPRSYRALDHIAHALIANPSLRVIEVRGHGGSLLPAIQGTGLARQRAEIVAAYLVAQGVAAARVTTRGVSGGDHLDPPDDPRSRQVELVILARDE
jgi:outer membrane protein OmpA-like peptidoglycan-associated protein